jgi:hypothetical protein
MTKLKKTTRRTPTFLTWTVRVRVHKSWVEDGFDMDDERAHEMLATYTGAHNSEIRAKVLTRPSKKLIRTIQGFP